MPDPARLRQTRGFTLIEVMVASFLVAVLLLILFRLFTVGFRIGHEEVERAGTEASLVTAARKLGSDLQNTTASGVTLVPDGSKLVTHPMGNVTSSRRVLYQDRMVYWVFDPAQRTLWRGDLTNPPGIAFNGNAFRLAAGDTAGLPLQPSGPGFNLRNRFKGIESFSVTNQATLTLPNVGSLLQLSIEANVKFAHTRKIVKLERALRLRSSGN